MALDEAPFDRVRNDEHVVLERVLHVGLLVPDIDPGAEPDRHGQNGGNGNDDLAFEARYDPHPTTHLPDQILDVGNALLPEDRLHACNHVERRPGIDEIGRAHGNGGSAGKHELQRVLAGHDAAHADDRAAARPSRPARPCARRRA